MLLFLLIILYLFDFIGFYACASYLAATARADWQFLAFTVDNRFNRWAADLLEHERIILACNHFYLLKQSILNGQGIGLLPDYAARADDRLVPVAIHGNTPETLPETLYLVMHEEVRRSPSVRAVADFWVQALAAE